MLSEIQHTPIVHFKLFAMKNKSCYPFLASIFLFFLMLVAGKPLAQTAKGVSNTVEPLANGDVKAVSARIASMYDANALIVELYVQAAINLENRIGISAPVVIAIAIHESSFKSELFMKAGNPFGIKASNPWTGPTYSKWHDGEETTFRLYNSADEAVEDFSNFVKSRVWYADALVCPMDDSRCVIDGLKMTDSEPGYSMNPDWDEAVLGIIQKVGLQELAVR